MRIRRDVSSIPFRSAGETWQKIIDLVTGPGSVDLQQLRDARGVMGSIITDEHPAERAHSDRGCWPAPSPLLSIWYERRRGRRRRRFAHMEPNGRRLEDVCSV